MTFDSDYAMETSSEARRRAREERKAKEDAEHAALNALLEQGKPPHCNSIQLTIN